MGWEGERLSALQGRQSPSGFGDTYLPTAARRTHKEREEVMGDQRRLAARERDARAHLLRDTHIKYIRDGAQRREGQCEIRPSSRPRERSFWSAGTTV